MFDKFKEPKLPGAKYGPPQWSTSFQSPAGIGLKYYENQIFLAQSHCQIEILMWGKFFWPICWNPTFLPFFGLFLSLLIRNCVNLAFLSLKIHLASKINGIFKMRKKIVCKSEIWPIWPIFGPIWPTEA